MIARPACLARESRKGGGFILVFCLPLLAALALVSLASYMSSILEFRMSANLERRERAFQAAEYAIEEALAASDLAIGFTIAQPKAVPSSGGRRPVPGSADEYSYRLHFLTAFDPGTEGPTGGNLLHAYHFVIEATGFSAGGAQDKHVQGFFVVRPPGWTSDAACPDPAAGCGLPPDAAPQRTYWLQADSE